MLKFYAHCPGMVYAISIQAACIKEAQDLFRDFLGVKRLPRDAAVWTNTQ